MSPLYVIALVILGVGLAATAVVMLLARLGVEPLHSRDNSIRVAAGKAPRKPWIRRRASRGADS